MKKNSVQKNFYRGTEKLAEANEKLEKFPDLSTAENLKSDFESLKLNKEKFKSFLSKSLKWML
jgi:hypothetical protein